MSSVVMQELYAGARSNADKRDLDGINRAFWSRGYMVTPEDRDWVDAGIILARYQRGHGEVEPRDHINDVLILLGAAKADADLVTENVEDMERWRLMLRGRRKQSRILGVKRRDHRC
jgi:predicted nucleic acid-binding protein